MNDPTITGRRSRPFDCYRSHPGQQDLELDLLCRAHGGFWGESPAHPRSDWQDDVTANLTSLGYWEWLEKRLLEDEADAGF